MEDRLPLSLYIKCQSRLVSGQQFSMATCSHRTSFAGINQPGTVGAACAAQRAQPRGQVQGLSMRVDDVLSLYAVIILKGVV